MGAGARRLAMMAAGAGLAVAGRAVQRRRRTIDLRGQVVLITGGSRGLGLAMAERFGREGARLALCARNPEQLEAARERLEGQGAEVIVVPCDIADREQVERFVGRALQHYGRVDILVNNAGIITVGPLLTQTLADFETSLGVMFWGVVYPTLAVLPDMLRRRSGRIVNITSIGGKVSVPQLVPYNCAKFAAVGFSEGIRAELARYGILVTTVVPGLMRTGSYVNALYKGKHRMEYSLFSVLANLPVTSINVEDAAAQVVRAARRGDSEIIITPQAQLLTRFHGLFPGFTADMLSLVNRILPEADGTAAFHGYESKTGISESFLTALGQQAAEEYQWGYPEGGNGIVGQERPV